MWWLRHLCTWLPICVLCLSSTSGSQVRNGNSYNAYSIVTTSQPANSYLGEFDLTDFVPAIPPQQSGLLLGFTVFPLTVSNTTGKTIASVYTPAAGPRIFSVGSETELDGIVKIPGSNQRVPLTLLIHARDTPILPTTTLNVSLSELYFAGVAINFSVSYPASTVNVRLAHNSSLLVNTSIAINNTLAIVKWARPAGGMFTPESSIVLDLTITDNAKGRSVLQPVQQTGTLANFTAPRNGASRENLTLNVIYPVCNASSLMAQGDLSSNSIFFTIMNKPTLLKVSFRCTLGYEEVGQSELLCTDDGVFTPSNPPTCRRVVCPVPTMACPNARLVSNSSTYQYASRRDIVCESGYRAVSKNGSSMCEANRTSSIVCPKCEAIPCDTTSLEDILPPNIDINRFSRNGITNVTNSVTVFCETGYNQTGDGKYQCLLGPLWSKSSTTCEIVDCGTPPVVDNSNYTFQYTTFEELANYSCVTSYVRKSGDEALRCSADGSWVGSRIVCSAIPCDSSSLMLPENVNISRFNANGITNVTNSVTVYCETGHNRTGDGKYQCLLGPLWSNSSTTCEIVDCGTPPVVDNSNYTFQYTTFKELANYSCVTSYERKSGDESLRCSADGSWVGSRIVCSAIPCKDLSLLANLSRSNVALNTSIAMVAVNESTQLQCRAGYTSPVLIFAICQLGGVWDIGDFNCTPVVCQVPPPAEFGSLTAAGRIYLSRANISCDNGYEPAGGVNYQTCSAAAEWQPANLKCQKKTTTFAQALKNPYYLALIASLFGVCLVAGTALGITCYRIHKRDLGAKAQGNASADGVGTGAGVVKRTRMPQLQQETTIYGAVVPRSDDTIVNNASAIAMEDLGP